MDGTWDDIRIFLAVYETLSFTGAARSLGLTQSSVSRRIARLEATLGETLFHRGRHGATPTARAIALVEHAEPMARAARTFERLLTSQDQAAAGEGVDHLRIAAPPGIAVDLLGPLAADLAQAVPAMRLQVRAGIEHVDLARDEADVAIRSTPPEERGLTALLQLEVVPGVFAAQRWLDANPGPHDWRSAHWISWAAPRKTIAPRPMLERLVPGFEPVFESDDWLVQKSAARAGLGCMILDPPLPDSDDARALTEVPFAVTLPASSYFLVAAAGAERRKATQRFARALCGWLRARGRVVTELGSLL